MKILWLFLAGGCGTLARYGLSAVVQRSVNVEFPWGTFAVNITGCFLAGLFWAFAENRITVSSELRAIILVGFLGGFTTFAAFMLESGNLLRDTQLLWFTGNLLLQNGVGLAGLFVGITVGRLL